MRQNWLTYPVQVTNLGGASAGTPLSPGT